MCLTHVILECFGPLGLLVFVGLADCLLKKSVPMSFISKPHHSCCFTSASLLSLNGICVYNSKENKHIYKTWSIKAKYHDKLVFIYYDYFFKISW